MNQPAGILKPVTHYLALALMAYALSGCANPPPPEKHVQHIIKPHYQADAYILHLSLANLILDDAKPNMAAAAPHEAIIEAYSAQKHQKRVFQSVVILDYTVQGKEGVQQTIAPLSSGTPDDFSGLQDVIGALDSIPHTLQNIHPVIISISPMNPLEFPNGNVEQTRVLLNQQLQILLRKPHGLLPLKEAQLQAQLVQFFTAHHEKEAAYISLENARQALAAYESNTENDTNSLALSQQLDTLESQLHKEMPFSISF